MKQELGEPMTPRSHALQHSPLIIYSCLVFLCLSYFGKYFCTSDMYVVQSDFVADMDLTSVQLSVMFAVGYVASMFGKLTAGTLADAINGKCVVLLSVFGYVASSFCMSYVPAGSHGFVMVLIVWFANGFFALGLAWVAVVAVATNYIPVSHLGRIMSIVNMAPQVGDALGRVVLAQFVHYGWRTVFRVAGFCALGLAAPMALLVRDAPDGAAHRSTHGSKETAQPEESFSQRLAVLLRSPLLWILCLLSGSLYGTRTLFLIYSTRFLAQVLCSGSPEVDICASSPSTLQSTASASSLYTILGCVSVIIVGFMKDWLPKKHRAAPLAIPIAPLFLSMLYLAGVGTDLPYGVAVCIVALTGFCLFGPYKILGSVFSVDVGGTKLKATACSLMGVSDNFFAVLMMLGKGYLGDNWALMFTCLSILSFVSFCCAALIWFRDLSAARRGLWAPGQLAAPLSSDARPPQ